MSRVLCEVRRIWVNVATGTQRRAVQCSRAEGLWYDGCGGQNNRRNTSGFLGRMSRKTIRYLLGMLDWIGGQQAHILSMSGANLLSSESTCSESRCSHCRPGPASACTVAATEALVTPAGKLIGHTGVKMHHKAVCGLRCDHLPTPRERTRSTGRPTRRRAANPASGNSTKLPRCILSIHGPTTAGALDQSIRQQLCEGSVVRPQLSTASRWQGSGQFGPTTSPSATSTLFNLVLVTPPPGASAHRLSQHGFLSLRSIMQQQQAG